MKTSSVRSDHALACTAYIAGYPFLLTVFIIYGVFDFMRPVIEFSLFDLMIDPNLRANACRQSTPCNLSYFAYFLVPLEITRRGIKFLFRAPMFPAPAHPRRRTWVHFVAWCVVVLLLQKLVFSYVKLSIGIPSADIAAVLGVLICAGLATRHSIRIRVPAAARAGQPEVTAQKETER